MNSDVLRVAVAVGWLLLVAGTAFALLLLIPPRD